MNMHTQHSPRYTYIATPWGHLWALDPDNVIRNLRKCFPDFKQWQYARAYREQ